MPRKFASVPHWAICAGSVDPENFDTLGNDWDIGERCRAALDEWGLHNVTPDTPAGSLSGGERTRVMLAGSPAKFRV